MDPQRRLTDIYQGGEASCARVKTNRTGKVIAYIPEGSQTEAVVSSKNHVIE